MKVYDLHSSIVIKLTIMRELLALLVLFSSIYANAEELTLQQAKKIASQYLASAKLEIPVINDIYCIVCDDENAGYVIIDRRKVCKRRVIGLSKSKWDNYKMPPILKDWLQNIENNNYKSEIRTSSLPISQTAHSDILPLLTTHWHQNSPYNDLSPIIADGNVKTVAGCVAIAAAQITYYWHKDNPLFTLKDTPTYIYGGAPVSLSIPKGSPNRWDLILDQYTKYESQESRAAVAQLCYVIGTTSYLNYASSTGGSIRDAANAMLSQYGLLSEYVPKSKLSYSDWFELLYNNIKNGYPVMCSGVGDGGHAFVLDGYDSETGLFHFNFGWGGSGDGYYPIDDTEESMGGYFKEQSVVYDIHPVSKNIVASLNCAYDNSNASTINVTSTVKNNSTLPIRQLFIYAVSDNSTLEETVSAIWQGPEIENDGIEHHVSTTLNIDSDKNIVLYLTDERKYELAHYSLDVESSVENTTFNKKIKTVYNLFGQKVSSSKKGIYVIDYGTHKKKIIKRYD